MDDMTSTLNSPEASSDEEEFSLGDADFVCAEPDSQDSPRNQLEGIISRGGSASPTQSESGDNTQPPWENVTSSVGRVTANYPSSVAKDDSRRAHRLASAERQQDQSQIEGNIEKQSKRPKEEQKIAGEREEGEEEEDSLPLLRRQASDSLSRGVVLSSRNFVGAGKRVQTTITRAPHLVSMKRQGGDSIDHGSTSQSEYPSQNRNCRTTLTGRAGRFAVYRPSGTSGGLHQRNRGSPDSSSTRGYSIAGLKVSSTTSSKTASEQKVQPGTAIFRALSSNPASRTSSATETPLPAIPRRALQCKRVAPSPSEDRRQKSKKAPSVPEEVDVYVISD